MVWICARLPGDTGEKRLRRTSARREHDYDAGGGDDRSVDRGATRVIGERSRRSSRRCARRSRSSGEWSKRADSRMLSEHGHLARRTAGSRCRDARDVRQGAAGSDRRRGVGDGGVVRAPNANRDAVEHRALKLRQGIPDAAEPAMSERAIDVRIRSSGSAASRGCESRASSGGADAHEGSTRCDARWIAIFSALRLSAREQVAEVRDRGVNDGAVLVVENATGEVWAYVGGAGEISGARRGSMRFAPRGSPARRSSRFSMRLRSSVSLLTAASIVEDTPLEVPEERGLYRPLDYDRQFRGLVSMRTALASSLNVPAVRTAEWSEWKRSRHICARSDSTASYEDGDFYGAAIALGSADVTLWRPGQGAIARSPRRCSGRRCASSPALMRRRASRASISEDTAYMISDVLADRASRSATFGLENSLATPFWSAVKTGTSKDMRDNWCVGYTRRFTVGVWVGNSYGCADARHHRDDRRGAGVARTRQLPSSAFWRIR